MELPPPVVEQQAQMPQATAQAPQGPQPFDFNAFQQRAQQLSQGRAGTNADFGDIYGQLSQEFQGLQRFGSKNDKIRLPNGEVIDAVISSGLGGRGLNWNVEQPGSAGGGAPAGPVSSLADMGWSPLSPSGAGGSSGINVGNISATPLTAAQAYNPKDVQGQAPLTLGQIGQPAAVNAQQVQGQTAQGGPAVTAAQAQTGPAVTAGTVQGQSVGAPERVSAQQVTGPEALTARNVSDPSGFKNLTAEELQQDPSYQFRLKQGLGALQNSAAAKGLLHTGGTLKGLNDYAGESASQEYQAANERNRQTYQQNLLNNQSVIGQNNAAQAQAYGLTNQFGQAAQLANQGANLNAAQFNSQQGQQAGMFNASNAQQANLANVGNQLQAGIFNSGQQQQGNQFNAANQQQAGMFNSGQQQQAGQFNAGQNQQAALANQGANLQAGQFNAGMNFNTQQANLANQLQVGQFNNSQQQQNAQFNAGRQDQAAQNNFQNQFAVEQGNNANALGAFGANTSAQLGAGSLANQSAANANSYNLGLGNLALGNKQADQSYNLGLGGQELGWANFGLNQQGQDYNQGLQTFNTNYGVFRDNRDTQFNQNLALAGLGQNSAVNYGNQAGNLYTNQGAANGNAQLAGGGAWAGALGNIGNMAGQAGAYWGGGGQQPVPYNGAIPWSGQ